MEFENEEDDEEEEKFQELQIENYDHNGVDVRNVAFRQRATS